MPTSQTPEIPVEFWKQLAARWLAKNPKFFDIYKKYSWIAIGSVATLTFFVELVFPMLFEVPDWLTITNRYCSSVVTFLVGYFSGNIVTSNITLKTPDTPLVLVK